MPIPLTPIAGVALRYGTVALVAYAATRRMERGRHRQVVEDAMEEAPDGLALRRDEGEMNGSVKWKRTIRLGHSGPGIEIDATGLGRVKIRKAS